MTRINQIFFSALLALNLLFSSEMMSQEKKTKANSLDYTKYVDPLIGSGGHGHVFVGANVPFGAVQLGPVNIFEGWDWCSGYNYSSNTILGFTHTHLSGTGIGDLNDILLLPFSGKTALTKGTKTDMETGYGSYFSHKNEVTKPGYYSVLLDKYKIKAELTASERVGFHKYTFESANDAHILLDLADGIGWDKPVKTFIKKISDTKIAGYRYSTGWAADQRVYFAMEFSQPIKNMALYDSITAVKGTEFEGLKMKAVLDFVTSKNKQVLVKVGISPVSYENASANIQAEIPNWNFEGTVKEATSKWNTELNKIQIKGNDKTMKVFYTSLYHTMFAPSIFNDANGDYRGTDKKVYEKANFTNYTTFSLWDTYRALHPLYTITQPDKINDIVKSFLAIYQQQGRLPVWHLMGNETNTMNGNHSIAVIVDAYLKGYRDYDTELAYEAVKKTAMQKREGMDYVQKLEYIPADKLLESVGNALEYAIDDYCIALMAKALNRTDDYDYFTKRANLYKLYFDKETTFMRGKLSNGNWRTPFNPLSSAHRKDDYVEGNAWQYTWLVPQDPYSLIDLFGSEDKFLAKLDSLFLLTDKVEGEDISPDISGLIGQYAQGNEPNHHIPYLYAYAGQPWKTAKLIREIDEKFYSTKPDGLCGNEDLGQMSAWYIFSSMGFYSVNPANGIYVLGSPLVNNAVIHYKKDISFTLTAVNNSAANLYIQKAEYNGKPYTKSYITHDMIVKGGELKLFMGSKPSTTFGVKKEDRPL
ncbi:GH92 family glycosyl hydrolase [Flavobacterium reichenbachii]|uniref:Sugar hydrolase n=1 Tax=Flavobacterium reichenbachii TaxID=362418 RepID=A0A085ZF14_9FLAO|nr:GH92 family glycosyl hydrolase [Flavobacterium reichenbachii]KFF03028.1 sugar hydrolase [Flavobacterium reichenbachii]OXB17214.1 sugar hydrolase [Flavobacterium reichenbachii]